MKWTAAHLRKLENKGVSTNLSKQPPPRKVEKISVEKRGIETMLFVLHREGTIPGYVRELEFSEKRKFRFDWAIPEWKLAIEYEGIFSEKSGHTTIKGYTKDCDKYNLGTLEGWKILRYTAKNYQQLAGDLRVLSKI